MNDVSNQLVVLQRKMIKYILELNPIDGGDKSIRSICVLYTIFFNFEMLVGCICYDRIIIRYVPHFQQGCVLCVGLRSVCV